MRAQLLLVMFAAALASACGNKPDAPTQKADPKAAASTEAICEEHGVLEAICTKCNPKLITIFKAKGDYCEDHGFPMSVCPVHHPERGGRPAVDVKADAAPLDGTKVRLKTQDTARLAGIKSVKAESRPGGARLEALVSITYDATKWAQVNARAPGVVREVKVDIGAKVKPGTALAVIDSASVGADRSRMRAAGSRIAVAEANYQRETELLKQGLTAQKSVLAAKQELDVARAERSATGAALDVVGKSAGTSGYVVTAPITGVVTKRNVTIGHMVGADDQVLFEIVDTSSMSAEIDIPETDLRRVRVGHEVTVTTDAIPDAEFTGTIDYIAPEVQRETRTTKARARLANPDGSLRANMFGRATIALGAAQESVVVPQAALQQVKEIAFVFVKLAEGEYELRRVKTGIREAGRVELTQGVKPDEAVVTDGSFLLKTETLKGSIGAGCCE